VATDRALFRIDRSGSPAEEEIQMLSLTCRFRRDEGGATATEYAMLIVFVALASAAGAQTLGGDIAILLTSIGTSLANIILPSV
jgi:Flp pilus assembly pilin Flp